MAGPKADESPAAIADSLIAPKPDGTPYSRPEMETRIRDIAGTTQVKRLITIERYGLHTKVAYDMKPITVIHWLLDKMIDKGEVQGNKMNISSDLGADHVPETFNQFCQVLSLFIENGSALRPLDGEIPMDKLNIPPPPGQPVAPGQPAQPQQQAAFTPPPPPPMPGAQPMMAQPPPPPTMAPAVGAPPGVPAGMPMAPQVPGQHPQAQMPMAPALPQGAQMPMPPQAPQAPQAPALPPPTAPPAAAVPPPGQAIAPAAPAAVPTILIKENPARVWGVTAPRTSSTGKPATRRLKSEIMEDQAWESAGKTDLPTMTLAEAQGAGYIVDQATLLVIGAQNPAPQQPTAAAPPAPADPPPQTMAQPAAAPMVPAAAPMAPPQQQMVPALPMASVPAPQTETPAPQADATGATLRELSKTIAELKRQNSILDMALSIVLRMNPDLKAALNSQGVASCEEVLKELNLQVPQ